VEDNIMLKFLSIIYILNLIAWYAFNLNSLDPYMPFLCIFLSLIAFLIDGSSPPIDSTDCWFFIIASIVALIFIDIYGWHLLRCIRFGVCDG
jgi:hypothetical protein